MMQQVSESSNHVIYANECALRLVQLKLINHAIKTLAENTWKNENSINFENLHQSVLRYKDADGKLPRNHDWSTLSNDDLFKPSDLPANRFKEFEDYFLQAENRGKSKLEMKNEFNHYLTIFVRIRNRLTRLLASQCMLN